MKKFFIQLTSQMMRPVLPNLLLLLLNLLTQLTETMMCLRTSSPPQLTAGRKPNEPLVLVSPWTQTLRFPLSWAPLVKRENREEVGWKQVVKRQKWMKGMERGSVQVSHGGKTRRHCSAGALMSHLWLRGWDKAPCHFQVPDPLTVQRKEEHLHHHYQQRHWKVAAQQSCTHTLLPLRLLKSWKVSRRTAIVGEFVSFNGLGHFFHRPSQPIIILFWLWSMLHFVQSLNQLLFYFF